MEKKYLVFKADRNGFVHYKKAKTLDIWSSDPSLCWKYSKAGAKKIADRYNGYNDGFNYGIEEVLI